MPFSLGSSSQLQPVLLRWRKSFCGLSSYQRLVALCGDPFPSSCQGSVQDSEVDLEGSVMDWEHLCSMIAKYVGIQKCSPFPSHQHQSYDRIQTAMWCEPIFRINFAFSLESVCIQLYFLVFNTSRLYGRKTSSGAMQDILESVFFWQISKPNRKFGDWQTAFELNPFERLEIYWLTYTLGRI